MRINSVLLATSLLLVSSLAQALQITPYTPGALKVLEIAGKPHALHFHADWCPTCQAQRQSFQYLMADKDLDLTLLTVDYDRERALRKAMKVRAQSTVIVFKGHEETARSGGETDPAALKALLKTAL